MKNIQREIELYAEDGAKKILKKQCLIVLSNEPKSEA